MVISESVSSGANDRMEVYRVWRGGRRKEEVDERNDDVAAKHWDEAVEKEGM